MCFFMFTYDYNNTMNLLKQFPIAELRADNRISSNNRGSTVHLVLDIPQS